MCWNRTSADQLSLTHIPERYLLQTSGPRVPNRSYLRVERVLQTGLCVVDLTWEACEGQLWLQKVWDQLGRGFSSDQL